jgi:hypothetical protein
MFQAIKISDQEVFKTGIVTTTIQNFVLDNGKLIAEHGSFMQNQYNNNGPRPPFNPNETPPGPGCVNSTVIGGSSFVFINGIPMAIETLSKSSCHESHLLVAITPSTVIVGA